MQLIKGSYALCIMTEDTLIGVRDPNGIRPLCLGKLPEVDGKEGGYILASESCAIDSGIGAAMGYAKASGIPYVSGIIKTNILGVHLLHQFRKSGKIWCL